MTDFSDLLRTADPASAVRRLPLDARAERELDQLLHTNRPAGVRTRVIRRVRPGRLVPAATALVLVLAALFLWPGPLRPRSAEDYAIGVLRGGTGPSGGGSAWGPTSVLDAMPSVAHRLGGTTVIRGSRLVVQGRFVSWAKGRTYAFKTGNYQGNSPEQTVPWNDPHAQRRELALRLRVDAVIDHAPGTTDPSRGDTLTVDLQVQGRKNAARVAQGLIDLGEIVPFLGGGVDGPWQRHVPPYLGDPPALLATLDRHGALQWPLLGATGMAGDRLALRVDAHTITELRNAAQHPRTVNAR